MIKIGNLIGGGVILLILFNACQKEEIILQNFAEKELNLPEKTFNYVHIELPGHLTENSLQGPGQNAAVENDNTPTDNYTTDDGATLGRVLFYEKKLSANGTISCSSCHKQEYGFSDNEIFSKGFDGGLTRRHSMSLMNAKWYGRGRFFWDERAGTLEEQVLMPFQDPVEMGMTLEEVLVVVQDQYYYPDLFEAAFGTPEITIDRIAKALAQFVRSIVSINSKYDEGRQLVNRPTNNFPNFTDSENNGKRLFFLPARLGGGGCIGCHSTEAFINPDNGTTNNGIDAESIGDLGVFGVINNPAFLGCFKVPSLKSVALTAPYMHDGRFATLEDVIDHYNSGIQNHPNLGTALRNENGQPLRLNWSEQEKADVVSFLKTLTDDVLAYDEKFSDPFDN